MTVQPEIAPVATRMLEQEARALLTRLDRLQPYSLRMPMVASAAISPQAMTAIEHHMARARRKLHVLIAC